MIESVVRLVSPQSSQQWASCHLELAPGLSLEAPLVRQTRWALHSLWSPEETLNEEISVGIYSIVALHLWHLNVLCS